MPRRRNSRSPACGAGEIRSIMASSKLNGERRSTPTTYARNRNDTRSYPVATTCAPSRATACDRDHASVNREPPFCGKRASVSVASRDRDTGVRLSFRKPSRLFPGDRRFRHFARFTGIPSGDRELRLRHSPNVSVPSRTKMELSHEYFRPACPLGLTCLHDHRRAGARPGIEPTVDFLSRRRRPGHRYLLSRSGTGQCADRAPAPRLSVLITDVGTTIAALPTVSSYRPGLSRIWK